MDIMTKHDAENIIDTIHQLSTAAKKTLDTESIRPEEAFSGVKYFLGTYCDSSADHLIILDSKTIHHCRQYLKTAPDGYYTAMEFFDIDLDPIRDLAEYLDGEDRSDEAELIWAVADFADEIREWTCRQSDPVPDQPYATPRPEQNSSGSLSEEQFLALFDDRSTKPHKTRLLLDHILNVSGERNVHTYYGALVSECRQWFKFSERDFASLLRNFLAVAGLDTALADNVRETKLGSKVKARAKEKIDEINRSRNRR